MSARPPLIVFAHANGFPAGTYRLLFDAWRDAGFEVRAIERIGHDARFPVSDGWPHLRDELVGFVAEAGGGAAAWLVGHSLGGFLSAMVASRRPELARGVVLLDSPILGGLLAHGVGWAKATGWGRRWSPARVSQRRRDRWPSAEAAHAHFAAKPAFARWAPEVLADYIAAGVPPAGGGADSGHALAFARDVETAIYDGLPHRLDLQLRLHPPRCPMAFIGGKQSTETRQVGLAATKRHTHGRVGWIDGTHLFPFERPRETADAVLGWLREFERAEQGA